MTDAKIRYLFSRNLRRIRTKQNISQLELADETGLTHTFINDIENCKKWISPDTIARLCNILHVEPFQFFLSERSLENHDKEAFFTYVDDLSVTIVDSVSDFKESYLNLEDDDWD
jgi:transcriptional regulator with XRE-family HTH domain